MNFSTAYFTRYQSLPPFFSEQPDEGLQLVVMIPCYDDPFIFETLRSLEEAHPVESKIEVLVVVNSGEQTPADVIERNRLIFEQLQQEAKAGAYQHFRLLPMLVEGTPRKKAGVGFARKTGLDEAVRRFAAIDRPEGLILSLDADSLVDPRYFQVAEKACQDTAASCFTFQFQHAFNPEQYSEAEIHACKLYEIYLRYYRLALKTLPVPFAIHTIGSCFAIRAEGYIKVGGMPVRQAGEDFYFLQKAGKMQPVRELNERIVFPAPRISERVPFGTGASVRQIVALDTYRVYHFALFNQLRIFYELFPRFEKEDLVNDIPAEIRAYIGIGEFKDWLIECRVHSSSSKAFVKRMLDHFDAFFIIKFLNTFDESSAFPPMEVHDAAKALLNRYGIDLTDTLYEQILWLDSQY